MGKKNTHVMVVNANSMIISARQVFMIV